LSLFYSTEDYFVRLVALEILVEEIDSKTLSDSLEIRDVVRKLLDGLDLLLQKFAFEEIGGLRIVVVGSNFVESQELLVHLTFQSKSEFEGLEGRVPCGDWGLLDVVERDTSSTLVNVVDELLGMLALLIALVLEEIAESREGNIVSVKVSSEGLVGVRGSEFRVDLSVDGGLESSREVLASERHSCCLWLLFQ